MTLTVCEVSPGLDLYDVLSVSVSKCLITPRWNVRSKIRTGDRKSGKGRRSAVEAWENMNLVLCWRKEEEMRINYLGVIIYLLLQLCQNDNYLDISDKTLLRNY